MKKTVKIALVVLIVVAIGVFGCVLIFGGESLDRNTTDLAEYGNWYGMLARSNLLVFPNSVPKSAENAEYIFYNDDSALGPSSLLYLKCTYSDDVFRDEIARLESIDGIRKDEEHYNGTAYLALLQKFETEYALIVNRNTIVYLCIAEGANPKTVDRAYLRKIDAAEDAWFSLYDFLDYDSYRYWPDSWKY